MGNEPTAFAGVPGGRAAREAGTPSTVARWPRKGGGERVRAAVAPRPSPHVYRRLPDVLAAQQDTITILHTLRPLIVAMAGPDEFDPYKD